MAVDVPQLSAMSQDELDSLYSSSEAGEIPRGEGAGTALIAPGTRLEESAEKLVHLLAWQGKVFDPDKGELRNEILPFGLKAIRARVYKQASWLDEKETIVLDYSETSVVAHWIRTNPRGLARRLPRARLLGPAPDPPLRVEVPDLSRRRATPAPASSQGRSGLGLRQFARP